MNMRWMTSAVLSLGVCAAPALAGQFPGRVDARIGVVPVDRDWREHRDIAIGDVPHRVIETAERFGNGRHIDSVVLVRSDRGDFFVVHMSRYRKHDINMRIDPAGGLIAIDRY